MKITPIKTNLFNTVKNCPCPKPKSNFTVSPLKNDVISFTSKKPKVTIDDISPLYSEKTIEKSIERVAEEINDFYKEEPVTTICLLKGGATFSSDLTKKLDMPLDIEYERLSSYEGTESTGKIKSSNLFDLNKAEGKNILIVEDIIDTGITLTEYKKQIEEHNPKSVKIVVLCDKESDRRQKGTVKPDFTCIKLLGDDYIIGCGMDYNQQFRNLPYIGSISKDKLKEIAEYEASSN